MNFDLNSIPPWMWIMIIGVVVYIMFIRKKKK